MPLLSTSPNLRQNLSTWATQTLSTSLALTDSEMWQWLIPWKLQWILFGTASHKTSFAFPRLNYCCSFAPRFTTHSVYDLSSSWTRSFKGAWKRVSACDVWGVKFHSNTAFCMSLMCCAYSVTHSDGNLRTYRNVQYTILIRVTKTPHYQPPIYWKVARTKATKQNQERNVFLTNLDFVSSYSAHAFACGLPHMPRTFKAAKLITEEFRKFSSEDCFAEKKVQSRPF